MDQPNQSPSRVSSAPQHAASVLVIILNFNGIADTLACLESLATQTDPDFAVLVIDNGSRDDDLSPIHAQHPNVEVMALPQNLGWAGGNNVGMKLATERGVGAVCLLNNDTVLFPTTLADLRAASVMIAKPCLLHPVIAFFDQPDKWQIHPLPIAEGGEDFPALDIVQMTFAYGACMWLSGEVLARVGLFDERFFLQLEESDYFERAKPHGFRSYCARRAKILHKESATFGGKITPAKTYYQVRNSLLMIEKHARSVARLRYLMVELFWALIRQARASNPDFTGRLALLRWLFSGDPLAAASRAGMRDYALRRFGKRRMTS